MRRLIRKAAHRDEQEQTTPAAPSASSAMLGMPAGEAIDGPPPIPFSHSAPPSYPGLDAVPNPILFVRYPALTIFYANPAAEAALAVSRRQLVEMSLHELFADPSELAEMIATVAMCLFRVGETVATRQCMQHPEIARSRATLSATTG